MASEVKWALILGGSSGLGLASAKKLAHHGYNIIIVHRDRRADEDLIIKEFQRIASSGVQFKAFNADALNTTKRASILNEIASLLGSDARINVLVHSIAKGSLKPMNSESEANLKHQDFQITLDAMALSLYDWTKELAIADLFAADSRIIAFTSE